MPFKLNKLKIVPAILGICLSVYSCSSPSKAKLEENALYKVVKTSEDMELDGLLNEKIWQVAEVRTFDNFYRTAS